MFLILELTLIDLQRLYNIGINCYRRIHIVYNM